MHKKISLIIISLLSFSLIVACSSKNKTAEEKTVDRNTPSVSVEKPVLTNVIEKQTALGSVYALDYPTIAAEVAGKVKKVYVDAGQNVKQGDLLAEIDKTALTIVHEADQATAQGLLAQLNAQADNVKRQKQLITEHYTSKAALEDATSTYDNLHAQWQAASKKVEADEHDLSKTKIYSPINGTVQSRNISVGDFVTLGTPTFSLINTQKLQARITFPETVLPLIKTNQAMEISSVSNNQIVHTKISAIVPGVNTQTRGIEVIANFDNPGQFMPGASATASVVISEKINALMIPTACLIQRPQKDVVFTLNNHHAVANPVTTGIEKNNSIEITHGLSPKSTIICEGAGFLEDGSSVNIAKRV